MDDDVKRGDGSADEEVRSAPPLSKDLLSRLRSGSSAVPERPAPPKVEHKPAFVADSATDSSTELNIEDAEGNEPAARPTRKSDSPKGFMALLSRYWKHKWWTVPLTLVVLLLIGGGAIFAMPSTRYQALGYFVQRDYKVTVTDSATGAPVSDASVTLASQTKQTNSAGEASFILAVGNSTLKVAKTYYKETSRTVLIDLSVAANTVKIPLTATGRPVPIKVVNKITGKAVPEAVVTVGTATAKADINGQATIVVAADVATQDVAVTVDGYNDFTGKIKVTTEAVDANTFAIVPAGRMYFLSNLSGKMDVVSTNLDGSGRKTVLAGTGKEDNENTSLLASRDWKYLVLLSKRDGGDKAKLFLVTTSSDKVTTVDTTAADFSLIGWSDHSFMYQISRPDVQPWQPNAVTLASYNAETNKSIVLLNTTASGTSNADAQYETVFQTAVIGGNLVYSKTWYRYPGYVGVAGQQNVLVSIKPDGTGAKTLKTVDAAQYYVSSLKLAKPDQLYFAVYDNNTANPNYYRLDGNGNITQSSTITSESVNKNYPTYLASPSSKYTFWRESRDGKNTLFVGDGSGSNGSQIASLSDYAPYGWYSDDYLLVQKNNSELYIMPAAGGTPLKMSDYYKPDYSYFGYGGGYGGL